MKTIKITQFGKDHWSTFAYLETCAEGIARGKGVPDVRRMRACPALHPQFCHSGGWSPEYGTRLAGFFKASQKDKKKLQITNHDDWSCLDDCEENGLIENIGTGLQRVYVFTDFGHKVANQLREHKRRGLNFADFVADLNVEELAAAATL